MTSPLIMPDDILIRKFRIDDELPIFDRQYIMKDGVKRPVPNAFKTPSDFNDNDSYNTISAYVKELLERTNIPIELVLETITWKKKEGVKYGAFFISVKDIEEYSELIEVLYAFDTSDLIPQRGLCHVNITFKDRTKATYKSNRKAWARKLSELLDTVELVEVDGRRF